MASLREAFDSEAQGVPALGDIDAAIRQVDAGHRRWRLAGMALAAAAVVTAVVWGSALATHRADSPPANRPSISPSPSATDSTLSIHLQDNPLPLATSPLPKGADAVARVDEPRALIAIAGNQQRTAVSAFRIYTYALSPDGRLLAWSGASNAGTDSLNVLDLTTGRQTWTGLLRAKSGGSAQTPHLEWTADGRHLLVAVLTTASIDTDHLGEVQLYASDSSGRLSRSGPAVPLPGRYVGVDRAGTTLIAVSAHGTFVAHPFAGGSWTSVARTTSATPPGFLSTNGVPDVTSWQGRDSYAWSAGEERIAWADRADASPTTVGWVSLSTGRWATTTIPGANAAVLGWRGTEYVVLTHRADGGTDISAVNQDGSFRLVTSYKRDSPPTSTSIEAMVALDHLS